MIKSSQNQSQGLVRKVVDGPQNLPQQPGGDSTALTCGCDSHVVTMSSGRSPGSGVLTTTWHPTGGKLRPHGHLSPGVRAEAHWGDGSGFSQGLCPEGASLCSLNWASLPRALFSKMGLSSTGETGVYIGKGLSQDQDQPDPKPGGQQPSTWGLSVFHTLECQGL